MTTYLLFLIVLHVVFLRDTKSYPTSDAYPFDSELEDGLFYDNEYSLSSEVLSKPLSNSAFYDGNFVKKRHFPVVPQYHEKTYEFIPISDSQNAPNVDEVAFNFKNTLVHSEDSKNKEYQLTTTRPRVHRQMDPLSGNLITSFSVRSKDEKTTMSAEDTSSLENNQDRVTEKPRLIRQLDPLAGNLIRSIKSEGRNSEQKAYSMEDEDTVTEKLRLIRQLDPLSGNLITSKKSEETNTEQIPEKAGEEDGVKSRTWRQLDPLAGNLILGFYKPSSLYKAYFRRSLPDLLSKDTELLREKKTL